MAQCAVHSCDICDNNPGSQYCTNCEQYFCSNCEFSHLKAKISKNHIFIDAQKVNPEEKIPKAKVMINCIPSIVIRVLACCAKFV